MKYFLGWIMVGGIGFDLIPLQGIRVAFVICATLGAIVSLIKYIDHCIGPLDEHDYFSS